MKKINNPITVAIRWAIFLAVLVYGGYYLLGGGINAQLKGVPVEIIFVGTNNDADCTILIQADKCVVVDTGEGQDAQTIVQILKDKNISKIDLLILTHPDKDHIGGANWLMENMEVQTVIQPQFEKENKLLASVNETIKEKGIRTIYPTYTRNFRVGEMLLHVYCPLEKHYNNDNNYSLATLVQHGKVNILLAGDAQEKRITELMKFNWRDISLYKVNYHGRAVVSSAQFIELIKPQFAVITAATADTAIAEACENVGAEVFYTVGNTVTFTSDGETLKNNNQPLLDS